MDDFDDIKNDIKEIKHILVENTVRMAEYNSELRLHIKGVNDLNTRMVPIEDHVKFLRKLSRAVAWGIGLAASGISLIRALFFK